MRTGKKMTMREKELYRRCLVFGLGALFFFVMAAVRSAGAGEYGFAPADSWAIDDEEEYDVMSYDDHVLAARLNRRVVGNRPVYYRKKASQQHDAITIVVNESTSAELESSNDLKRDASNTIALTDWLIPSFSGGKLGTSQRGESAGGNTPKIQYSSNRAHKSDSSIERTQTFTTTLTGRVIDVRPNGYLVIEASKSVNVNGEDQTVSVTGMVNPAHMDSNSRILAEYIIDMKVTYTGKGPMSRMDRRGEAGPPR